MIPNRSPTKSSNITKADFFPRPRCPEVSKLGLDRYCAGARYPDTIGRSYTDTDTDTGLSRFFYWKNAILCGV